MVVRNGQESVKQSKGRGTVKTVGSVDTTTSRADVNQHGARSPCALLSRNLDESFADYNFMVALAKGVCVSYIRRLCRQVSYSDSTLLEPLLPFFAFPLTPWWNRGWSPGLPSFPRPLPVLFLGPAHVSVPSQLD